MQLGAWLIAMVTPLVGRVLFALGFQVVTVLGMVAAFGVVKGLFLTYLGGVQAAALQLALLAGIGPALGMIFGAITFRIALYQIQSATKILGVASAAT